MGVSEDKDSAPNMAPGAGNSYASQRHIQAIHFETRQA
jgi:hypothetical protein